MDHGRTAASRLLGPCLLYGALIAALGGLLIVVWDWMEPSVLRGALTRGASQSDAGAALPVFVAAGVVKVLIDGTYVLLMAGLGMVAGACALVGAGPVGRALAAAIPGALLAFVGGALWAADPKLYALIGPSVATVCVLVTAGLAAAWRASVAGPARAGS